MNKEPKKQKKAPKKPSKRPTPETPPVSQADIVLAPEEPPGPAPQEPTAMVVSSQAPTMFTDPDFFVQGN